MHLCREGGRKRWGVGKEERERGRERERESREVKQVMVLGEEKR